MKTLFLSMKHERDIVTSVLLPEIEVVMHCLQLSWHVTVVVFLVGTLLIQNVAAYWRSWMVIY